jgi:hypothetical protein
MLLGSLLTFCLYLFTFFFADGTCQQRPGQTGTC